MVDDCICRVEPRQYVKQCAKFEENKERREHIGRKVQEVRCCHNEMLLASGKVRSLTRPLPAYHMFPHRGVHT